MSWEVWTMKSKLSFFDPTLLKKNVSRFAPAWAILLVSMLLTYPTFLLRRMNWTSVDGFLRDALISGPFYAFFAAILFAGLLFKYLHKTRSAYMMHAFPMTRACLFVTNTVSGLLFYLVPMGITVLSMQGILMIRGCADCDSGLLWAVAGKWLLEYLFFYGLAIFCCLLSGGTVISVLSYFALNFIVMLIPVLVQVLTGWYFYGLDWEIPEWIVRLSPIVGMVYDGSQVPTWLLLLYAAVGLGLGAGAWALYRCRHVERAGDAMAYGWARVLFRLVFTFCGGLYLGFFFASFHNTFSGGRTAFLPYAIVGVFLGWFGATMMLQRTVKVFRQKKVWLGFAVFCGVLAVFVGVLRYDVLGWQRRVPEAGEIESVEIWTYDYDDSLTRSDRVTITDPTLIDQVRSIHNDALTWREQRTGSRSFFDGIYYDLHIVYHLKDGTTIRRAYEMENPQRIKLDAIYRDGRLAAAWYEEHLPQDIALGTLYGLTDKYGYAGQSPEPSTLEPETVSPEPEPASGEDLIAAATDPELWDEEETAPARIYYDDDAVYCHDGAALRAALIADAAAGRLSISPDRYYLRDDGTYLLELTLTTVNKNQYTFMIPSTAVETLALFTP